MDYFLSYTAAVTGRAIEPPVFRQASPDIIIIIYILYYIKYIILLYKPLLYHFILSQRG